MEEDGQIIRGRGAAEKREYRVKGAVYLVVQEGLSLHCDVYELDLQFKLRLVQDIS